MTHRKSIQDLMIDPAFKGKCWKEYNSHYFDNDHIPCECGEFKSVKDPVLEAMLRLSPDEYSNYTRNFYKVVH